MYASKRSNFFVTERLTSSNPQCAACHSNFYQLKLDTKSTSLASLIEYVVEFLNLDEGELSVEEGGRLIYDLDFEDNKEKMLTQLGLVDGKRISFTTQSDEDTEKSYSIILFASHQ